MTFTPSTAPEKRRLRQAARLWGLQPDYTSAGGATVCVPERTLVLLLQVLSGRTVDNLGALDELVQWARERLLTRWLESVHVIRAGATQRLRAHLPESAFGVPLELNFECEAGERFHEHVVLACPERWREFRGRRYGRVWIPLSRRLEAGYHHLEMRLNGECKARARLLCAPDRSKRRTSGSQPARCWGGFAPLYGLQSSRDWGIGDLRDMEDVQSFLHSQGAAFFGTLPLLSAVNEGETADPSPYSPVSRLFWNEIFLDVDRLVNGSPRVKTEIEEPEFQAAWERLRKREFVEHRDVYALKKKILRALAREFFDTDGGSERLDYKTYLSRTPGVDRYAEFRAQNRLESPDRHEREKQYHLYVQYQMDSQLRRLHERSRAGEIAGLYLDYPVGVSKSGFDSREFASRFVHEVNAGAPPDTIFPGGQDWGFSPFHPQGLRDAGYDYFIECMRRNMRYASVLRLDHIMAFFRIYAIPEGVDPKSGTYIRYRAEEFFAILEIESQRASVRVVGEDLGTVPERVRQALVEHGCLRMWVLPFEAGKDPAKAIAKAPTLSLACMNTHDMIPFAGFLKARDLQWFRELNVIDAAMAARDTKQREKTVNLWRRRLHTENDRELLLQMLARMAASPSELVLVNLEDLWGETEPQNIPGTWREYPNWRRKLRRTIESWPDDDEVMAALAKLRRA